MSPGRFARLKEILLRAADLPEAERARSLVAACLHDPELRKEAVSILAHDADPPGILRTGSRALAPAPRGGADPSMSRRWARSSGIDLRKVRCRELATGEGIRCRGLRQTAWLLAA
jgi:hypothetical protein